MADRISIERSVNDTVVPLLDEKKILNLDKHSADRTELFLFAMALGVAKGVRTPLKSTHGFILETSVKSYDGAMSQIYSVSINELIGNAEEDKIGDKDYAYKIAEEYANTGFKIIGKWLNGKDNSEDLMWTLIAEMDERFEAIISEGSE